ncbi:MAG: addiction module protein [Candidatus Aminicenantes bacterium]|nr:addiction module protein [Candidatus Aminicenantes bacterium]
METTLQQLTSDALALPVQDRAKLAHTLISSIDEKSETDVSSAWDAELKKRVREIREGKVRGVPAEEVFVRLEKKYHCRDGGY